MNVNDLFCDLGGVAAQEILSDWAWLIDEDCSPFKMTAFGDLFLQNEKGHICFLDLVSGEMTRVATSETELATLLAKEEYIQEWLMPDLVSLLRERGVNLGERECYGFKIPPVLGGEISAENIEPSDVVVYLSILGQIHRQARDMPPGTVISGFTVDGGGD